MEEATTEVDWHAELIEQLEWHWVPLRGRLDGLTDDEYFWEPVPGCWTIRLHDDGSTSLDWASPALDPPPFTTIAWRLGHICGPVLGMRASNHFGDGGFDLDTVAWPASADAALDWLDEAHDAWVKGVRSLGIDGLRRKVGPAEGPFRDHSMAALVLHINREVIHHGAEVCCLRDLYRDQQGRQAQTEG